MNETELLIAYARAWNNLDTSYLHEILDENFEYNSQWVFETMHGKDNYIEYLGGKFETILKDPNSFPQAEMAYFELAFGAKDKPCLILSQWDFKATIMIQTENGKIIKADMVGVPDPETAIKLNQFPK